MIPSCLEFPFSVNLHPFAAAGDTLKMPAMIGIYLVQLSILSVDSNLHPHVRSGWKCHVKLDQPMGQPEKSSYIKEPGHSLRVT